MNLEQLRTLLQGKKTYLAVIIGALYLLGVWAGAWAFDEKVLAAIGLSGIAFLAAKINRNTLSILLCTGAAALLLLGCKGSQGGAQVGIDSANNIGGQITYGDTNVQGGLTGSYNVQTGAWTAGLVITFSREPSPAVLAALTDAGFTRQRAPSSAATVFTLAGKPRGQAQKDALAIALLNGAELTALPN